MGNFLVNVGSMNPDFEALLNNTSVDGKSLSTHFHEAKQRRYEALPTYLTKVCLGCPGEACCGDNPNLIEKYVTVDFNVEDVRKRYNPARAVEKADEYARELQFIECASCGESNERKNWYQETDTCPLSGCQWTSTRTEGCAKMICRCGVKWCWFCKKIKK